LNVVCLLFTKGGENTCNIKKKQVQPSFFLFAPVEMNHKLHEKHERRKNREGLESFNLENGSVFIKGRVAVL
jgi:hypothetical protein